MTGPRPITIDQMGRLGVDSNNRLYWDDRPVVTEQPLALSWWVNASIVAGGIATIVLAVVELLGFLKAG